MKKEKISLATKHKMAESLKRFMEKKSFDKITVRDILEDIEITRPTFYYHFEDIYDLMRWTFDTELLTLLKKSENCITWDDGMLLVLQYVEENRAVCLCAYNSIGRDMLQRLFLEKAKTIMRHFVDTLLIDIYARPCDVEFITEFYTMSFVSVLIQWLLHPNGRTPEDVIQQIDIAAHGDIEEALKRSAALNK